MFNKNRPFRLALSFFFLTLLVSLSGLSAKPNEQVYTVPMVPNVQLVDATRYVTDEAGTLTMDEEAELNKRIAALRRNYGVEAAVVVLPSIGHRDIEGFATELFRTWGLGKKDQNNGLLFLLVMDQRAVRIEVGYGLEGDLPDITVGRIQRKYMFPAFREEAYGRGLIDALGATDDVLSGSSDIEKELLDAGGEEGGSMARLFLILYLILCVVTYISLVGSVRASMKKGRARGETAMAQKLRFEEQKKNHGSCLSFVFLPGLLLFYLWATIYGKNLNKAAAICPNCHNENTLYALKGVDRRSLLNAGQQCEEQIGSRRYSVYRCTACTHQELIGIDIAKTKYSICPKCSYRTVSAIEGKEQYVLVHGRRYLRRLYRCEYCGHSYTKDEKAKDEQSNAAGAAVAAGILGGILGGGRGGGRSGGFGGGGFGGGSSGGGGATGRW